MAAKWTRTELATHVLLLRPVTEVTLAISGSDPSALEVACKASSGMCEPRVQGSGLGVDDSVLWSRRARVTLPSQPSSWWTWRLLTILLGSYGRACPEPLRY